MPTIRNSAKSIIIVKDKLLAVRNIDTEGDWYLLPGGGQCHGETLHETLQRECKEEIGTEVQIGDIKFIREYIGKHHEFAESDSRLHQIEFMFECTVPIDYSPVNGHVPDAYQTGVVWLCLNNLSEYRLYPSVLKRILIDMTESNHPIYLGDVN